MPSQGDRKMKDLSTRKKIHDSAEALIYAFLMAYMSPIVFVILVLLRIPVRKTMKDYFGLIAFLYLGSIEIWLKPENIKNMVGEM